MDSQFARPLTDFPQFWYVLAGICFLAAIYAAFSGYRRYHGNLFLMERISLWAYGLVEGKKKRKDLEKQVIADIKRNRIYGVSYMIGAIGSVLLSILFLYAAKFLIAR